MRKVHTADSVIDVMHLRNLLEQAGIACVVRNERLGGVVGEIPFLECWPELWVVRPGDALRARGVRVDALFFPKDYAPALAHEYQFNLDTDAGRQAMNRSVAFLDGLQARDAGNP